MYNETTLGLSKIEKALLIILSPIIGALLGWFIPSIAEWAIKIPFIPFEGVFEWIATLESQWVSVIAAVLGMLAGVFFVFYAFSESLKVTITDEQLKLEFKEKATTLHKSEISAIYLEKKELVILSLNGNERFRVPFDAKRDAVSGAFEKHRYPWKDKDPFENQYQRWIADHPDFPAHVNALISARERALKNEESEEAQVLRKDLASQGIVVRDKDTRQYVRIVKER
ncbi:hypothetical protein [Bacillus horti]|uniref:Uncharacterized protein YneF (UPF0154 family) n=1 Tax=Caldalkalibacillus horti TaxID=77523 RepID=A0ABT9VVC1_9BACI|nr:hypothetical protein [Bacillus horti]MDQ0164921.1 uncharacterized protein YneF (UPF0154 family) [Bacillus horti]